MNTKKKLVIFATMFAFLIMLPAARASEEDQATRLTFNTDVQIPGRVLPAGTYWFIVVHSDVAPNAVHVFNADRSKLYATILTINADRLTTTGDTAITFADRGPTQPETLVTWFYPGRGAGHEFVYPKAEEQELAQLKHHTVMVATGDKHQNQTLTAGR